VYIRTRSAAKSAGSSADLQDDVALIGGILRQEQELEGGFEIALSRLQGVHLHAGQLSHLGIQRLARQAPGLLRLPPQQQEAPVLLDQRAELGAGFGQALILGRVRQHGGVRQFSCDLLVSLLDGGELFKHGRHCNPSGKHRPGGIRRETSHRLRARVARG
jgi:hypothetical protein